MLTYSHARELMRSARDPGRGKPLANNTRLFDRGEFYAVQLHATDVVEIYPNGTWGLRHGGWTTLTTADRIREFSPASYRTWLSQGDGFGGSNWWVYFQRDPKDPKPENRERTIPKPFHAPDPGPEPIKAEEGCIAGTLTAESRREQIMVRGCEVVATDELPSDKANARRPCHPSRGRDVLAFIDYVVDAIETQCSYLWVYADVATHTTFGEESYRYGLNAGHGERVRERYEQCPHCKAFAQRHAAWHRAMHGSGWGQFRRGYSQMCEWLETFGSREEWQAEYIAEFRQVREAKRILREWTQRNRFNWTSDVIVIDANGELTKKCSDERRRADRARRREQRRQERAEERRAIEARKRAREAAQLERFKARVRAKRGESFTAIAREAAGSLANLAQHLDTSPTDELESCGV